MKTGQWEVWNEGKNIRQIEEDTMKTGQWEVWMKGKWIGIVETNYPYAVAYWKERTRVVGVKFELREKLA